LAVYIASKLTYFEKPASVFEYTLWSLFSSILIYVAFIYLKGITNYDSLSGIVFQSETILLIVIAAVFEGIIIACLHRLDPLKYLRRAIHWRAKAIYSPTKHVWDEELKRNAPSWVLVYTKNGLEYKGVAVTWTVGDTPKELLIGRPKLIIRDKQWRVINEVVMGDSILFLEDDIARVVRL